jgi:hypothetical protein
LVVAAASQALAKVRETNAAASSEVTSAAPAAEENGRAASAAGADDTFGSPAVRRFRQNASLALAYAIYNARLDKAAGRPQLTTQTRIYRDGQPVFIGKEQPVSVQLPYPDLKRIGLVAELKLGSALAPGEYVLQVVVTDTLRNDKHRVATQWIDFEIY